MKIYTKTGDSGTTGLYHPSERRMKCDPQIIAVGEVDELNAHLSIIHHRLGEFDSSWRYERIKEFITTIQRQLFTVGTHLATPSPVPKAKQITEDMVEMLENAIDDHQDDLPELSAFILPRGDLGASEIHLARAVCRRAERSVVSLGAELCVDDFVIVGKYLNRLSDYLFVLARYVNVVIAGRKEELV